MDVSNESVLLTLFLDIRVLKLVSLPLSPNVFIIFFVDRPLLGDIRLEQDRVLLELVVLSTTVFEGSSTVKSTE